MPIYRNSRDIPSEYRWVRSAYLGNIRGVNVAAAILKHLDQIQTLPHEPYVIYFRCKGLTIVEAQTHILAKALVPREMLVMWWTEGSSYRRGRSPVFLVGLRSVGLEDLVKGTAY